MAKSVLATDIYGKEHELDVNQLRWRPSVYAVIIKDNHVLAIPAFGGYALPGGGLELGETIEDALVREVQEEAGITVTSPVLLGVESNFFILPGVSLKGNSIQSLLLFYRCEYVSGELSDEGFNENEQEFGGFPEWLPLEKLPASKIAGSLDWRKYVNP